MRSFTVTVYDCTQCPHADHDGEVCLEFLNSCNTPDDAEMRDCQWKHAKKVYSDNCMKLTWTCPRLL